MRPFETSDVVFIETLKAKHATVKTQLAAAGRRRTPTLSQRSPLSGRRPTRRLQSFCGSPIGSMRWRPSAPGRGGGV